MLDLIGRLAAYEAVACRAHLRRHYFQTSPQKTPIALLGLVLKDAASAFLPPEPGSPRLTNKRIHDHLCPKPDQKPGPKPDEKPGAKSSEKHSAVKLPTLGTFLDGNTRVRDGGGGEKRWFERFQTWMTTVLLSRPPGESGPQASPDDENWTLNPVTQLETKDPTTLSDEAKDRLRRIIQFFLPPDVGNPPEWFSDQVNADRFWASSDLEGWDSPCCMKELIFELRAAAYFSRRAPDRFRPEIIRVSGASRFPLEGQRPLQIVYRDVNTEAVWSGVPTTLILARPPRTSEAIASAEYFAKRTLRKGPRPLPEIPLFLYYARREDFLTVDGVALDDFLSPGNRWMAVRAPAFHPAEALQESPGNWWIQECLVASRVAKGARPFAWHSTPHEIASFRNWVEAVRSQQGPGPLDLTSAYGEGWGERVAEPAAVPSEGVEELVEDLGGIGIA